MAPCCFLVPGWCKFPEELKKYQAAQRLTTLFGVLSMFFFWTADGWCWMNVYLMCILILINMFSSQTCNNYDKPVFGGVFKNMGDCGAQPALWHVRNCYFCFICLLIPCSAFLIVYSGLMGYHHVIGYDCTVYCYQRPEEVTDGDTRLRMLADNIVVPPHENHDAMVESSRSDLMAMVLRELPAARELMFDIDHPEHPKFEYPIDSDQAQDEREMRKMWEMEEFNSEKPDIFAQVRSLEMAYYNDPNPERELQVKIGRNGVPLFTDDDDESDEKEADKMAGKLKRTFNEMWLDYKRFRKSCGKCMGLGSHMKDNMWVDKVGDNDLVRHCGFFREVAFNGTTNVFALHEAKREWYFYHELEKHAYHTTFRLPRQLMDEESAMTGLDETGAKLKMARELQNNNQGAASNANAATLMANPATSKVPLPFSWNVVTRHKNPGVEAMMGGCPMPQCNPYDRMNTCALSYMGGACQWCEYCNIASRKSHRTALTQGLVKNQTRFVGFGCRSQGGYRLNTHEEHECDKMCNCFGGFVDRQDHYNHEAKDNGYMKTSTCRDRVIDGLFGGWMCAGLAMACAFSIMQQITISTQILQSKRERKFNTDNQYINNNFNLPNNGMNSPTNQPMMGMQSPGGQNEFDMGVYQGTNNNMTVLGSPVQGGMGQSQMMGGEVSKADMYSMNEPSPMMGQTQNNNDVEMTKEQMMLQMNNQNAAPMGQPMQTNNVMDMSTNNVMAMGDNNIVEYDVSNQQAVPAKESRKSEKKEKKSRKSEKRDKKEEAVEGGSGDGPKPEEKTEKPVEVTEII